jgi:SAM-dependent methyltransferase
MNGEFDPEKFKSMQKTTWSSVAQGWHRWLAPSLHPVTTRLIGLAGIPKGSKVLDVACGDGRLALAAATAGAAEVIAADLAPSFGPIVEEMAQEAGMKDRLHFQECDIESLPFEDRQFDVVFCQFGLMFAPNRKNALREIYRTLKPQGLFGAAVWRTADENTALASMMQLLQAHLPPRPEGAPTLFACGTPNLMASELHSIGFRDYQETNMDFPLVYQDAASAWKAMENTGPFAAAFAQWDSKTRKTVKGEIKRLQAKFKAATGTIEMPSRALLFYAKRGFETLQL